MAMPELLGVSPFAPPPGSGLWTSRLKARAGGVFIVLIGLFLMECAISDAAKAAGYVSDQGTVTIRHCRISRGANGDDETVCAGVFHPADGSAALANAEIDGQYVPGERVKVYREAAKYSPVSMRSFWSRVTFFFLALLGVTYGIVMTVVGFNPKDRFAVAREKIRGSVMATPVKWLLRVGGAGTLTSFLMACVSP